MKELRNYPANTLKFLRNYTALNPHNTARNIYNQLATPLPVTPNPRGPASWQYQGAFKAGLALRAIASGVGAGSPTGTRSWTRDLSPKLPPLTWAYSNDTRTTKEKT